MSIRFLSEAEQQVSNVEFENTPLHFRYQQICQVEMLRQQVQNTAWTILSQDKLESFVDSLIQAKQPFSPKNEFVLRMPDDHKLQQAHLSRQH